MRRWPKVALGDVLSQVNRFESVRPESSYPLLGVRLEGNGAFLRETVAGTETSATRLNRVESGDFIYSRLFAWRGAFAVIGHDLAGSFVSNEFPVFTADKDRVCTSFLRYWFRLPTVWRRVEEDCSGSTPTTRNRYKEQFFLSLQVPLPPLAEQQAIASRLDTLADKARQVNERLDAIEQRAAALFLSLHHKLAGGRMRRLGDVVELHEESVPVRTDSEYPQVGVRGFGGGLFPKAAVAGTETSYRAFNRLYVDALVLSQVKGWEGALALCPAELAGMYVSPEYRTFRCIPGEATPAYIGELVRTPWFWSLLQDATRGVGARRERTRPEQFLNIELPMPLQDKQRNVVEILDRLSRLRSRHATIRQANEALIPAMLERIFSEAH